MRLVHQIARRVRRQFGGTLSPEEAVRGELDRLGAAPRHTPLSSGIFGFRFDIVDGASFCACYDSIVRRGIYAFPSTTPAPYIIDCGANVGVSILAFKKSFPDARIVAFEPDPMVFAALRANVERAGWSSVEVVNKAVWCDESELEFWQEGSDAGRLERRADANPAQRIRVQTARLTRLPRGFSRLFETRHRGRRGGCACRLRRSTFERETSVRRVPLVRQRGAEARYAITDSERSGVPRLRADGELSTNAIFVDPDVPRNGSSVERVRDSHERRRHGRAMSAERAQCGSAAVLSGYWYWM